MSMVDEVINELNTNPKADAHSVIGHAMTGWDKKKEALTDIKFPKKRERKEKQLKERIIVSCTTSWDNKKRIKTVLKKIGPKEIEFIVTGTSKGEQLVASVALELGIMLYRTHPWISANNDFIVQGKAMKIFKPTQVIAFNEDPEENRHTLGYQRLCRRSDIVFKMVSK